LAVCLVGVVAACSFFYTGDGCYWGQKETYSFIWRNLALYPIQWDIPGVFENNFMATVNGSLWTLAPQFTLYILILALFFLRKHRPIVVALSFIALIICLTKNIFFADKFAHTDICYIGVNSFARSAQFFVVGMLLHERKWFITGKARLIITGISATLAVALIHIHTYIHTAPLVMLCVSVIFIMVGEMYWKPVSDMFKRVGDLSYGVYIYSFPIQQMIIASIPGIAPRTIMALTIVIALPVAFASWRIIERPALSLKKYL
jgi:peptidoglycan/LPS O-acetylase OafA/YrhL